MLVCALLSVAPGNYAVNAGAAADAGFVGAADAAAVVVVVVGDVGLGSAEIQCS